MCFDRTFNTSNKMFKKYAGFLGFDFFMFMPEYSTKKLNDNRGGKYFWDRVNSIVIASKGDLIEVMYRFLEMIIDKITKIVRDPQIVAEKIVFFIKDFILNNQSWVIGYLGYQFIADVANVLQQMDDKTLEAQCGFVRSINNGVKIKQQELS